MKKAKHERQNHTIKNLATGKRKPFPSINAAKRESRKLQIAEDGAIGRGSLRLAR